jgi:hypothetical protein
MHLGAAAVAEEMFRPDGLFAEGAFSAAAK